MVRFNKSIPDFFLPCIILIFSKGESAVLRVSFALCIIFILQIIGTFSYTRFYDYLWVLKFILFFTLLVAFFFVDGDVFNLNGYAWFARILGFCFIIIQAIIIIDVAYSWNESWLKYSEELNGGILSFYLISHFSCIFIISIILL